MAISLVAISSGSSLTVTEPTGTASGDVMVACVEAASGTAITAPDANWHELSTQGDTGKRSSLWWCLRGGSAPGLIFGGGATPRNEVRTYRGVHQTTPCPNATIQENASSTTPSSPGFTPTDANSWMVVGMMTTSGSNSSVSFPTGVSSNQDDPFTHLMCSSDSGAALGSTSPTGTKQWTNGTARTTTTWSVEIAPPASGFTSTIASKLAHVTSSLTAGQKYTGTVASTLPHLTSSLTAVMQPKATIASTLAHLTSSLTAKQHNPSVIAATLPHLTASFSVKQVYTGTIASTLPHETASLTAKQIYLATIVSTLAHLTSSLTAKQKYPLTIASTLAHLTASLSMTYSANVGQAPVAGLLASDVPTFIAGDGLPRGVIA